MFPSRSRADFAWYLPSTAPEADDHFGLTLVAPRFVRKIKITGSPDLAEVLAWEHAAGGGDESWQLFTVRQDSIGGWVRSAAHLSTSRSRTRLFRATCADWMPPKSLLPHLDLAFG